MGKKTQKSAFLMTEPSMALNAVCPYYTMFPLDFPLKILNRFKGKCLRVLDPFCGRGTTIFAARIEGHCAYGMDSSRIATAIARAKLAETSATDVTTLAEMLLLLNPDVSIPEGEFWHWAFARSTLREVCALRRGLMSLRGDAANLLRAVCLGALHGPLTKTVENRSYFSNQMPRTFASKPRYSIKYWKTQGLRPVAVDVLTVIKRRIERLELKSLPSPVGTSRIQTTDSRLSNGYASLSSPMDLVITSPPYYGMKTYVADQWLRNWFLGGPAEVPYNEKCQLSHRTPEEFAESLSDVWNQIGKKLRDDGKLFVRFGAIPSRKHDTRELMRNSLQHSRLNWKICKIRPAQSAQSGKRQADLMGKRVKSAAIEEHDYEIALRD